MIDAIQRNWKALATTWKALGLISAILLAGGTGALWADDLQQQVAANTNERMIQTYDRLLRKLRAEGKLDPRDAAAFCQAARYLRIGGRDVRSVCG